MRHIRTLAVLVLGLAACSSRHAAPPSSIRALIQVLDFNEVKPGQSLSRAVPLEVHGSAPIEVLQVPDGFQVEVGQNQRVLATFAPRSLGPAGGLLVLGAGEARATVRLVGVGYDVALEAQPGSLEFGAVGLGDPRTLTLDLTNASILPASVRLATDDPAFSVYPRTVALGGGEALTLTVTFEPLGPGPVGAHLLLVPCEGCAARTVPLSGTGATESWSFDPPALDFGAHPPGTTTCREVALRNDGELSLQIEAVLLDAVASRSRVFTVTSSPPPAIQPGQSGSVNLCFSPDSGGQIYGGTVAFQSSRDTSSALPLQGSSDGPLLVARPASLVLGVAAPEAPVSGTVLLGRDGGPGPLVIRGVHLDRNDPDFSLSFPDGDLAGKDPGDGPLHVTVTLAGSAGEHAAVLLVDTEGAGTLQVPVSGLVLESSPCQLEFPASSPFGSLHAGEVREVSIHNLGNLCTVWGFALGPGPFEFADGVPGLAEIEGGHVLTVKIRYAPVADPRMLSTATLSFQHVGAGGGIAQEQVEISAAWLPPELTLRPSPLTFGAVPLGFVVHLPVEVVNGATTPLEIAAVGMSPDGSTAFSVEEPTTTTILPGDSLSLAVAFRPTLQGPSQGMLRIDTATGESLLVPASGSGGVGGSNPLCDSHCDGDFLALCPEFLTLFGTTLALAGDLQDRYNDPPSCSWKILASPDGADASVESMEGCRAVFATDTIGPYTLELVATDTAGRSSGCETHLHVIPSLGLRVETTWSSPGDVDLHLFHPSAGDPLTPGAWFNLPYDCSYDNEFPYWDTLGRADDPHLIADDTSGRGPETIVLDSPSGIHSYAIGVHWFANPQGASSETVATRVYCMGKRVAEVQTVLGQVLTAAEVGTVSWDDSTNTCTFKPVNQTLRIKP